MNVNIKVIPHFEQRYETPGDYWVDAKDVVQVRVSEMENWRYEMLVAVHELVEFFVCQHMRIDIKRIDAFDIQFEKDRKKGLHPAEAEPGDHKDAPYKTAHFIATTVERLLAVALGVDWNEYDYAVYCLALEAIK